MYKTNDVITSPKNTRRHAEFSFPSRLSIDHDQSDEKDMNYRQYLYEPIY